MLLKAGASLRLRDTVGTTPIREGLRRGFGPELREIITELGIEGEQRYVSCSVGIVIMLFFLSASDDPLMDTELRELLTDKAVARKAKRNVAFPQKRMKGTMCSCQCHPFPGRESIVRQLEGGVRALDVCEFGLSSYPLLICSGSRQFPFVCDNEYSRFVSNSKGTQASALVKGAVQRSLSQDGTSRRECLDSFRIVWLYVVRSWYRLVMLSFALCSAASHDSLICMWMPKRYSLFGNGFKFAVSPFCGRNRALKSSIGSRCLCSRLSRHHANR